MIFSNKAPHFKPSYRYCLLIVSLLTQLTSCAFAPWEKTIDKSQTPEAQVAEVKKEAKSHPEATVKRKNLLVTQELASTQLLLQAEQAKVKGLYAEASNFYDRVLGFLPEDINAINGKLEVEREMAQLNKVDQAATLVDSQPEAAKEIVRDVLIENPQHAEALILQQQINAKLITTKVKLPELKPQFNKPVTLELRDVNIKVVFEALSRATGINFILDKDIKPETKATIFIKKARIEDAIEMVLSSNGLQKKVLSENTALVFPSTQAKLKDYQDLMIRSFYFSNTSAKQVSILLKTMLKTKDIFVDERLNMLVMRDTPEVIRIAEKLVAANDLEDPEVMLDIEVLEVSRSRLQELGIVYPNQLAVLSAANLTLEALKSVKSPNIGVSPSPGVNFKKTIGDVNLLSNPRIRVRNNEKAKIMVGDKVPIITTTSLGANVGVAENITYVDVGLKLDVEPRITLNDFVNIKIGLEVSSLGEKMRTNNGATAYTIGTRNANTVLRLKNGETQILAGLILDDERKNASRLPGLGDIPLVGRLFSNQEDKKSKTEIVLAITPRIIGNISLPQAEISEYWSGTENLISDKPQTGLPVSSGPLSPREQFREKIKQQQLKANPEVTPETSSATEQEPILQTQDATAVDGVALPASADNAQPNVESATLPVSP
ncbi:MAG: type II secretion system protein GspD [Methylotenera sp.]|nr:type II secretion system protein GspD [Methylotenera sp.]MDP2402455.1 type II secretion system protein GspD [Methylotenera sp.]MDZ4222338.1 type II secretion system protein GspD [Methylotenera sp.]